jgi:hypothetical protein
MAANEEVKPINWVDQIAHMAIGFFCSLPVIGGLFSVIAREYYQAKIVMFEVYRIQFPDLNWKEINKQLTFGKVLGQLDFAKRDLIFSYWGVILSTALMVGFFWIWIV